MTTAAIYARKSTDQTDRDESVRSVTAQRDAAVAFIKAQGRQVGPRPCGTASAQFRADRRGS
jgi:DNA invertase Pin-like site-specific DNA recombinase